MDPGLDRSGIALNLKLPRGILHQQLSWRKLLWLPPLVFLGIFYFYPLGSILGESFRRSADSPFGALGAALTSASIRHVIGFTVWQAVLSTILTLMLGLPAAYLIARFQFRGKSLLQALTGIPFVMPTLVVAAGFNALLGPRGWVNQGLISLFDLPAPPIQFTYSLTAILVAHVFYNTTIVMRTVGDFWSRLDPRLPQAAQVLGASPAQALWRITLPLLSPAVAAAALLVFIFDFTSFGVVLILGGPRFATLEVEIYYQTISLFNLPLAAALSVLQLAFTLGLTILYTRLAATVSRPLNLRPPQSTQRRVTGWRQRVLTASLVGLLVAWMILPLAALALRSITRFEAARGQGAASFQGLTLDYYRELNINRRSSAFYASPLTSIGISLGYASATVLISLALGLPAAWALARDPESLTSRLLDPLLMLPLGTSAVTLGLGMVIALSRPPFHLSASPVLIPLAHTLVAFPFVVRSLTPALRSIRPRLHQAAAVLGASPARVFQRIDLPLAGRAILVAATFAFTISLGEFGATALISRPEFPTVPMAIFRLLSQPGAVFYGQAMALSTILMLITGSGMLVIERLRLDINSEF